MFPEYMITELARISGNIVFLDSAETVLIWVMMLLAASFLIGLLFAVGASSDLGEVVAAFSLMFLIIVVLIYGGVWTIDCIYSSQYAEIVAQMPVIS